LSSLRRLLSLAALAIILWCLALRDYWHFTRVMSLRYESCRQVQLGHLEHAEALLEDAFVLDPSQLDIAGDLAELYRCSGTPDRGAAVLDRAVALARCLPSELTLVYAQRGRHWLALGKFREASHDLRAALSWDPHNLELKGMLQQAERQVVWEHWTLIEPVPPPALQR
jgi:tetratricopeptide (TPR) repeat protein